MSPKWMLLGCVLLFTIGWVAAGAQDCPALVERALARMENACAGMRGNQACYGYQALEAQLEEGLSPFAFNGVGDITGIDTIHSLRLSALDPVKDEWGMTVMRVRADISDQYPDQNVTLLAFGAVSIDPVQDEQYQPMQAFAIQTGNADSGCNNITENGLLIQTPEGVGRVTLWINDVRVRVGSTVLFQAQPGADLTVSTLEGLAQVEAQGQIQEAPAGMRVRVPLDERMQPIAPPTPPELFDPSDLSLLVDVVTGFTDGSVRQLFVSAPVEVVNDTNPIQVNVTFSNPPHSANNPNPPVSGDQPPTNSPPTQVPPTNSPPTNAPPTDLLPTNSPPTDSPPTDSPPADPTPDEGDDNDNSGGDNGEDNDNGNGDQDDGNGSGDGGDDEGCNGDHGQGNGDGNCHGHGDDNISLWFFSRWFSLTLKDDF